MFSNDTRAAIVGIAGTGLAAGEAALFRACPPAGVILFRRNVADPAQLRALTAELRQVLPADAVLMVDQEGGRVARLRPPHWAAHPPAGAIGALFKRDPAAGLRAAFLTGALIGADCAAAGFDTVCAPVLDVPQPPNTAEAVPSSFWPGLAPDAGLSTKLYTPTLVPADPTHGVAGIGRSPVQFPSTQVRVNAVPADGVTTAVHLSAAVQVGATVQVSVSTDPAGRPESAPTPGDSSVAVMA